MVKHKKKLIGTKIVRLLLGILWCMVVLSCRADLVNEYTRRGDTDSTSKCNSGQVPVHLVVDGLSAPSRTITPDHITLQDLENPSKYTVTLNGTSNMGNSITLDPVSFSHGMVGLDLNPGIWTLSLSVTDVNTQTQILTGSSVVLVQSKPISTTVTLKPIQSEAGSVAVGFILSTSLLKRLQVQNPTPSTVTTGLAGASGTATLTATLYDVGGTPIPGTEMTLNAQISGASTTEQTLTYTANGQTIPAGQYTLKLTGSFPKQDGSIETMGYEDIIHIEGNRKTSASIALDSNSKDLGVPSDPYRQDKVRTNASTGTVNFASNTTFSPLKECVWMYADYWDGKDSDSDLNEVLVISWGNVYDADYYEVEILMHPFTGVNAGNDPATAGKFTKPVTTDAEWDTLKDQDFTYRDTAGVEHRKKTSFLAFSGDDTSPNYYKSKTYDVGSISAGIVGISLSCADYPLFKSMETTTFRDTSKNYQNQGTLFPAAAKAVFEQYGVYQYRTTTVGKIGLEAGCGALPVLTPGSAPRMSVQFRVRAVNAFGYSDWVYWKGGKW